MARSEGLLERARLLWALAALEKQGLGNLTAWIQGEDGKAHRNALPASSQQSSLTA